VYKPLRLTIHTFQLPDFCCLGVDYNDKHFNHKHANCQKAETLKFNSFCLYIHTFWVAWMWAGKRVLRKIQFWHPYHCYFHLYWNFSSSAHLTLEMAPFPSPSLFPIVSTRPSQFSHEKLLRVCSMNC